MKQFQAKVSLQVLLIILFCNKGSISYLDELFLQLAITVTM